MALAHLRGSGTDVFGTHTATGPGPVRDRGAGRRLARRGHSHRRHGGPRTIHLLDRGDRPLERYVGHFFHLYHLARLGPGGGIHRERVLELVDEQFVDRQLVDRPLVDRQLQPILGPYRLVRIGVGLVGGVVTKAPAFERFRALGTSVVVGTADAAARPAAVAAVRAEIETCDLACSRFRPDSELAGLRAGVRAAPVSEWLAEALAVALRAAEVTDGLVDPTVGQCLVDLGYDQTFERVDPTSPVVVTASHRPAWRSIHLDRPNRRVTVPTGVGIDLGATAKALCSDRAAAWAAEATGTGVLVSVGGDVAVWGEPPREGWVILVTDRSDSDPADPARPLGGTGGQTVAIRSGGLATSGTSVRRWSRAGRAVHHLVDPRTGRPADEVWRTVSVAAPSCVTANTASTAAMILGASAPSWLARHGHDARLVSPEGRVTVVCGWPEETEGPVAA